MKQWPLRQTVYKPGAPIYEEDRFGDPVIVGYEPPIPVKVYAWETTTGTEINNNDYGWPIIVDILKVYAPPGSFEPGVSIGTSPDQFDPETGRGYWAISTNADDHTHGPAWNPGLVVYEARQPR